MQISSPLRTKAMQIGCWSRPFASRGATQDSVTAFIPNNTKHAVIVLLKTQTLLVLDEQARLEDLKT